MVVTYTNVSPGKAVTWMDSAALASGRVYERTRVSLSMVLMD